MHPNGLALSLVRVSALFRYPPLNNFTKIKHSQQTTKPRIEFERVLQIVRLCHHTCQLDNCTNHEILKQICFERANLIAGHGKIGLDYKLFGKPLAVQCVCNSAMAISLFNGFIKK